MNLFLKEEENISINSMRNYIRYKDFFKKLQFLFGEKHYETNKTILKDPTKLDETDCVLCFTAITCLTNPIIYCSKCEKGAHKICLRLEKVPSEDFFCLLCSQTLSQSKEKHSFVNLFNKHFSNIDEKIFLKIDFQIFQKKTKKMFLIDLKLDDIIYLKFGIHISSKLHKIEGKWIWAEISIHSLNLLKSTLIEKNFLNKSKKKNSFVLDCIKYELYMSKESNSNLVIVNSSEQDNLKNVINNIKTFYTEKIEDGQQSEIDKSPIVENDSIHIKDEMINMLEPDNLFVFGSLLENDFKFIFSENGINQFQNMISFKMEFFKQFINSNILDKNESLKNRKSKKNHKKGLLIKHLNNFIKLNKIEFNYLNLDKRFYPLFFSNNIDSSSNSFLENKISKTIKKENIINNFHNEISSEPSKENESKCYFCNKSDLMLIRLGEKTIHLFCLICSGNLLDFFPQNSTSMLFLMVQSLILKKIFKTINLNFQYKCLSTPHDFILKDNSTKFIEISHLIIQKLISPIECTICCIPTSKI